MSLTNPNMTRQILIQVAVLAWIVTIFVIIVSGPLINKISSPEGNINPFNAHKKLRSLNVIASSEFDGIKNTTMNIFICNAIFLGLVGVVSAILTAMAFKPKCFWSLYPAILLIVFLSFLALTLSTSFFYVELLNAPIDPYKTDFNDGMISSLEANFLSDNVTTGSNISKEWNTLFMDYECCGVNKVVGTTNDFDSTPWCTTSGTCQATASQIPKTCCKGSTKYDYQNSPSDCHSSVSPGKYYEKGCYFVMKEEIINERLRFKSFTNDILTEGLRVVIAMGFCLLLSLVGGCVFIRVCRKRNKKNKRQNDSNEQEASDQSVYKNATETPLQNISEPSSPGKTNSESNKIAQTNGGTEDNTELKYK